MTGESLGGILFLGRGGDGMAVREGKYRIQITLSQVTLGALDVMCEEAGITRSALITNLIWDQHSNFFRRMDQIERERRKMEDSEN